MNTQIVKHTFLIFIAVLTLFAVTMISHAEDTVKKITFAELKGILESNKSNVVIVDLFATWCPPCRKEIPGFINLYNKYRGKGLEIIGISFDENGSDVVPPFIKKTGINYPVYLGGGEIAHAYDMEAYPTTIVYGKDGKQANIHIGYVSEKEFDDEVSELLKK